MYFLIFGKVFILFSDLILFIPAFKWAETAVERKLL